MTGLEKELSHDHDNTPYGAIELLIPLLSVMDVFAVPVEGQVGGESTDKLRRDRHER